MTQRTFIVALLILLCCILFSPLLSLAGFSRSSSPFHFPNATVPSLDVIVPTSFWLYGLNNASWLAAQYYNETQTEIRFHRLPSGCINTSRSIYPFSPAYQLPLYNGSLVDELEQQQAIQQMQNATALMTDEGRAEFYNATSCAVPQDVPCYVDVIHGIDIYSSLLHNESNNFLNLADIKEKTDNLTADVAHFTDVTYLQPFDSGVLGILYNATHFPFLAEHNATFAFEDLLSSKNRMLLNSIAIPSPFTDSVGLNFFLWTVATYGDIIGGIPPLDPSSSGDWTRFWRNAFLSNLTIVKDWNQAFYQMVNPETPQTQSIISFTSSIPYQLCLVNASVLDETNTTINYLMTHLPNGSAVGWLQVESMAVLGTSDNPVEAKKFVQWMQSPAVQQQIFTNQFMFPVIHNDGLQPACWQRVVDDGSRQPILSGSNVSLLNYRLPPKYLQEHLPRLLMQFKRLYSNRPQLRGAFSSADLD